MAEYGTQAYQEPLALAGRDAIVGFMRDNLGPGVITVHFCGQPEIDIGDAAAGTWCFEDTVIAVEHRVMIKGSAFYEDEYRREPDGAWRISRIGYTRMYEMMLSLDGLPSFRLLANRWADAEPLTTSWLRTRSTLGAHA